MDNDFKRLVIGNMPAASEGFKTSINVSVVRVLD
jgi:hypothetical protein